MSSRLNDKIAVVTGSTRGIGEAIVRRLAAEGARVVVSGIDSADGARVAAEIGATYLDADVRLPARCEGLIEDVVRQHGRLDVLVNNAGVFPSLSLEHSTSEAWDEVFSINVRGAYLCSRAAVPHLKRGGGGVIVNIGTTLAYRGTEDRIAYAASKGALLSLTKTMAHAFAKDRIRCNWVTVGWVASPGEIALRDELNGDGRAYLAERGERTPFGRIETADEIAAGVAYLSSDEAAHITGCELNISGGMWI
jgi:NAD(P)-dependent dehydrogenase (short-subunit alcohol dehydrogenase family)